MDRGAVLVTGARQGIGRGIALAFAEAGWRVVVNDVVRDDAAEATLALLGDAGAFVLGDVSDINGHGVLLDAAWGAFGGIDALVNNAGVSSRVRGDMLGLLPGDYDRVMAVNLRGPFFLTQAVARRWLDAPGAGVRSVVNISSINAVKASPERPEYCLSKAGVSMMTRLFALRLAEAGVGVFEIRPGIIRTAMTSVAAARYDRLIAEGASPVRRWGEPADVGGVAVALAEGRFHFSTGEAVHVDGGLHIARL